MLNDPLANALSKIMNAERISTRECDIKPVSKIIKAVFKVIKENHYIGDFDETYDRRGNFLKVNLLGRINKCGAIKPRFSVKIDGYEKFEKRFLPAKNFGILIISTPKGIMTQNKAKEKNLGGRLLAYCY